MNNLLPLGLGAWIFISCYLLSLLIIGWYAKKSRKENTLNDFYLAGGGLGFGVLFPEIAQDAHSFESPSVLLLNSFLQSAKEGQLPEGVPRQKYFPPSLLL